MLENAPLIPVSAHHGRNIDLLIEVISKTIPTPKKDIKDNFQMNIARSFDINKPGTLPQKIKGGVLGGTVSKGQIKIGSEMMVRFLSVYYERIYQMTQLIGGNRGSFCTHDLQEIEAIQKDLGILHRSVNSDVNKVI